MHSAVTRTLISRKNYEAKLTFAERHVLWTENWSKVHFSDESKFNLFGSDGKHFIRRQTEERLNPECVKKSVKGGGGRVMVWGMFSAAGVGPLIQLHGRWMQMFIRTSFSKMQFLPCKHLPISLQFSCRTMPPSHSKTDKAVPWS